MTAPKPPSTPAPAPSEDADAQASAEGFAAFVSLLEPAAPPATGLERLLDALPTNPLARFAASIARMLDVSESVAESLLAQAAGTAAYEPGPFPGVQLFHVAGGPAVTGAITGFVRIEGGAAFPDHEHLGDEQVFVLQGSLLEPSTGRITRAGELTTAAVGTAHATVARPGPDLVYLAVLREGLRIGETEMRADDPRL